MSVVAIDMEDVAVGGLRDLTTPVIEGVNWSAKTGDYWVIEGLQGSGKSDFMMMAASLVAPIRGSYRFFGEEMPIFEEERLKTRLRLGLVFDGGQLFNHLTVRENVELPLRYHRDLTPSAAEAEVTNLLEATQLGPWADSTPGAMGRNWHKRVGLARALILQPDVLLLDNPLGGLDPFHAKWWLDFLEQLSKGHSLMNGRPTTLIVTAADSERWRGKAQQFAKLENHGFAVENPAL
jgi:ABC-type transporter Mla maintaining outer membrane lipid asymmetry ATPase subunit MlaF